MTTRKGNESIVQKENNRTYNPVGLNKVSHFSRRGRAPSRLTNEEIKIFVKENTDSETFLGEDNSEKYTIVV